MSPIRKMIQKTVGNGDSILHREQRSIGWATFEMVVLVFVTKLLGLLKMGLIAGRFGAGRELDIFFIANTLPELIFNIIAVGSINAALIPTFSRCLSKEGHRVTAMLFHRVIVYATAAFTIAAVAMFLFAPQLIALSFKLQIAGVVTTFSPEESIMAVRMMRVMLCSPILLGISSIISAYLLLRQRYIMTRLAPLVYNIGTIIGITVLVPLFKGSVEGLAYGVVLSSVMHLLVQLPTLLRVVDLGKGEKAEVPKFYFRQIGKLALPRVLTVAAGQLGAVFRNVLAFNLIPGSLSALQFGRNLYPIAVDVFGTTTAEAIFPKLSSLGAEGKREALAALLKKGFQQLLFLTLPVMVLMLVLRLPIVRFAYGLLGPGYKWEHSIMTSWVLFFLSFLIVSEAVESVIVRGFYALSDTVTPFVVSLLYLALSLVLGYFFVIFFSNFNTYSLIQPYSALGLKTLLGYFTTPGGSAVAVGGLALGSAVARGIEAIVLTALLNKKIKFVSREQLIAIGKKVFSSVVMGMALYSSFRLFDSVLDTSRVIQLFAVLTLSTLVGLSAYLVAEYLVDDRDILLVKALFGKFVGDRFGFRKGKTVPGSPNISGDSEVT